MQCYRSEIEKQTGLGITDQNGYSIVQQLLQIAGDNTVSVLFHFLCIFALILSRLYCFVLSDFLSNTYGHFPVH